MSSHTNQQHVTFMETLSVVNRKMRKVYNARVAELGLTFARARVITLLARHQNMSQSALADELELEKPTLVRMLDRMADLDLIERIADPNDRRVNLIQLRPHGHAMAETLQSSVRSKLFSDLFRAEDQAALETATTLFQTIIMRIKHNEVNDEQQ